MPVSVLQAYHLPTVKKLRQRWVLKKESLLLAGYGIAIHAHME
jgi:hypothetical protein